MSLHEPAVWLRTHRVWHNGEELLRREGEKVGNIMQPWVRLKRSDPELFVDVLVLQQPAAYRDSIIVAWCMEDLEKDHKLVMMQHDLVGCQSSEPVKKKRSKA